MMELIKMFLENKTILFISAWLTFPLSITFIYLYFRKNGRDERGRGIFATSCFIAMCLLLVLINLMSIFSDEIFGNPQMVRSIFVHLYNLVLIVHLASTAILGKIR